MNNKLSTSFLLFFICIAQSLLQAQQLPSIQLDRPDQTECPFITPTKYIQIENGFNFDKTNENQQSFIYPTTLWKYGVNSKLELRVITEITSLKQSGSTITGLSPTTIGFKTALFEEKGIIPKTSFIGHITSSKIGTKALHTTYIAPSFRFTMQHTLSDKVVLAYNLGAEWNGETPDQLYLYTLTSGLSLTEKLGCYAELYGYISHFRAADHRCDGGITYLINDNFITDLSAGFGLSPASPDYYISLGISFRFKALK